MESLANTPDPLFLSQGLGTVAGTSAAGVSDGAPKRLACGVQAPCRPSSVDAGSSPCVRLIKG